MNSSKSCELCNITAASTFLFSTEHFHVAQGPFREKWPGHVMLVFNKHLEEQSDMDDATAQSVFQSILNLERSLRKLTQAARINFVKFGNVASHLHWHIVPRYGTEKFPQKCPWEILTEHELYLSPPVIDASNIYEKLKKELRS